MNNFLLIFDPLFPVTIIILIVLPSFIFLAYKEFQRKQKFLTARIFALALVMISLLALFLRPSYQEEKVINSIILLTSGYEENTVDSIIKLQPNQPIIRTSDAKPYPNSSVLKSWHDLTNENISYVIGEGIPNHAFEQLSNKTFRFISVIPRGITNLISPNVVYVNQRNQIQGVFNASGKTSLKLFGPGGAEDSVNLNKGENQFALSFNPKQEGLFIYDLEIKESNQAKATERLPIEVMPELQLKILFIQKYPTAEIRFLKNFLSKKKHQVTLRYQVSATNYTYEYANTSPVRMDNLRPEFLKAFDVLFIDDKSFDQLSLNEKTDLKKSIQDGLGVIIMPSDPKGKVLNEFLSIKSKNSLNDTVHIHLSRPEAYTLPVLPIELNPQPSIISVTKNKGRIISGYFFLGSGKIGFQFIQETYRLGLEGNADDYSSLWTSLIEHSARAQTARFKIKLNTPFPHYPNEPLDLEVISSGSQPSLYSDSVDIPMTEHVLFDDYWTGKSWTGKSGWHRIGIRQDSTQLNYFVSQREEWKTIRITNKIKETKALQHIQPIEEQKKEMQSKAIPSLIFYLMFLFSSAFLWVFPKI